MQFQEGKSGIKTTPDTEEEAFTAGVNVSLSFGRDPHPSPGRQSRGLWLDHHGSGAGDGDRWKEVPGGFASGQDLHLDVGFGGTSAFRHGHGFRRGLQRTGPDADRWQHASGFQRKGLIPSPQTPLQMMYKAEKKYEVEQAKQWQLKAILNKLTPENSEWLFKQVIEVGIDNAVTLAGLTLQIFDKALMEPTFCEMYANLCSYLSQVLPYFTEGHERITFKRLLVNKCQEEFERGEREELEENRVEGEGEVEQSDEQREEKRSKARRRMLGNIRLIGELYKKRMLTENVMHQCTNKLLGQYQIPVEEDLEALCTLMSTVGEMMDHPKAKVYMDAYFDRMMALSNDLTLSSGVRFMLKDLIDLRKNWQQRRKVEGPKKFDELHRGAVQERHTQAGRVGGTRLRIFRHGKSCTFSGNCLLLGFGARKHYNKAVCRW
ncbi:hypothetical protein SAY87_011145 [Trapa incisa]|uniref:MIF4G domain-containing protein n=1 Tax=Trapa incisa TaxID=236973 RepID=A0AAN7JIY7_9MYRT|nr:hypothetical protein SAY87_011145 [Trapa incisa]